MKITQMLEREDFYTINKKTLRAFFGSSGSEQTLYIYPRLNAIVTEKPAKVVRDYLLCEYSIRGSMYKRWLAQCYVSVCMRTHGSMSSHTLHIPNTMTDGMLIYPCNRKYRFFDFDREIVTVVPKYSYPTGTLEHEILFRKRKCLPDFVPKLTDVLQVGYSEKIIRGRPLSRIREDADGYRDYARRLLMDYALQSQRLVKSSEYADLLKMQFLTEYATCFSETVSRQIMLLFERLCDVLRKDDGLICLSFSHGDLQEGNIWIENDTDNIYIIDWETWGERSEWYDDAVLYGKLRHGGLARLIETDISVMKKAIIMLEDLMFHIYEAKELPAGNGERILQQYLLLISTMKGSW